MYRLLDNTIFRIVALLLLWSMANAPDAVSQLREPFFQHISVEQGLSQSSVYCILQDKKGFLWFGTGDGLNKYDGYEITGYRHRESDTNSIADNTIRALLEDKNGSLWIATGEALNVYNQKTGIYKRIPIRWVESIIQLRSGKLMVGSALGLDIINSENYSIEHVNYPAGYRASGEHLSVKSILEDHEGCLWIGNNEDIDRYNPATGDFHCFGKELEPYTNKKRGLIFSIAEDNESYIWATSFGTGLYKIDRTTGTITHFSTTSKQGSALSSDFLQTMYQVNDSILWIGSESSSMLQFNTHSEECTPLLNQGSHSGILIPQNVRSMCRDRSGIFWLGTDGDGVYKFDPKPRKFSHLQVQEGTTNTLSGNFLRSVCEDSKGRVWIGTYEHGVTMWDKAENRYEQYLTNGHIRDGKTAGTTVNAIVEDNNGTLWLGTDVGLMKFDEKQHRCITQRFHANDSSYFVATLILSHSGNLWVSVDYLLYSFDPKNEQFRNMEFDFKHYPSIHSYAVTTMFEDASGYLWLGTYSNGINKVDVAARHSSTYLYDQSNPQSISSNMIKTVTQTSDGMIWIGTDHGLNMLDPKSEKFTRFFEEDGLPSAYIYGILEDGKQNLWMSTNKGITKYTPSTHQFRPYGVEDGLQSSEFNTGAYFKSKNGEMYFGGINGLNYFNPDSVYDNPNVPQIVLTGAKLFDLPMKLQGEIAERTTIRLNYEDDIFSLKFAALEYSNIQKNQYAYMLEGFEQNWIYSGTRREVRYTHLDPGTYVFRVKGANNDGVWNNDGIALQVVVVPPFWRTWWFLSLTIVLILGSFGGTIRFIEVRRVRRHLEEVERERAMERERARISQDMHDEIGASLTKIAITSEIARRDLHNAGAIESHLQNISNNARDVVDSISEIVWAINPKNDRLDNLISFIREYASGFFEGTEIDCHFVIPDTIPDSPVSGEQRRNMLLVVKEALNNAAKHSGATKVAIQFEIKGTLCSILIRDNGNGFSSLTSSEFGNGLFNMKKRMESINGTYQIESQIKEGTVITLGLPLKSSPDIRKSAKN